MVIEALVLDLDGVVFWRIPAQFDAQRAYRKHGLTIFEPPSSLSDLETSTQVRRLRVMEMLLLAIHTTHVVFPGVASILPQIRDMPIYGNTGRLNSRPWVELTKFYLKLAGIDTSFKKIYHRPPGVATPTSKIINNIEILKTHSCIRVLDDNPYDLLQELRFFDQYSKGRVEGVLIGNWLNHPLTSKVDWSEYPNLRVVDKFRYAVDDLITVP